VGNVKVIVMLPTWGWVGDWVSIGVLSGPRRFGLQKSMHEPCKLRICREREGRSLCYAGSGGPCHGFMGLPLAQEPAEKPPRCHSFICAGCHLPPIILVHVFGLFKLTSAGPFQILEIHVSVWSVSNPLAAFFPQSLSL